MTSARQILNKNIATIQGSLVYLQIKFKRKTSRVTEHEIK